MESYIYIICIVFLLLLVILLLYKLYSFSMLILKMETSLEESLDVLNQSYEKVYSIAQKPVFFDSVEIRQVISEIKASHEAILNVANKLTYESGLKSETKEVENNEQ